MSDKAIVVGPVLWGINPDKPKLPEGWSYIEEKDCWLIAVSPTGQEYFVERDALYPRRKWSSGPKKGKFYIDTRGPGIVKLLVLLLAAICLTNCTTLYPENSQQREHEHEFFEHHMDNITR